MRLSRPPVPGSQYLDPSLSHSQYPVEKLWSRKSHAVSVNARVHTDDTILVPLD